MWILNFDILLIFIICFALSFITYYKRLLNLDGAVTAFFIAVFISIQGGLTLILLLLIFLFSAFLATKYKFGYKKERGIHEGLKGERGWTNVIANGAVPTMILILYDSGSIFNIGFLGEEMMLVLFVTSIAAAASDTLASEMGMVSDKAYLITNFKRVKPGTNGGISLYGEFWALIGPLYTFLVAQAMFYFAGMSLLSPIFILSGIVVSFMSCQIDSLLGATLERRSLIGKSTVNFTSIFISVTLFGGILWQIGY